MIRLSLACWLLIKFSHHCWWLVAVQPPDLIAKLIRQEETSLDQEYGQSAGPDEWQIMIITNNYWLISSTFFFQIAFSLTGNFSTLPVLTWFEVIMNFVINLNSTESRSEPTRQPAVHSMFRWNPSPNPSRASVLDRLPLKRLCTVCPNENLFFKNLARKMINTLKTKSIKKIDELLSWMHKINRRKHMQRLKKRVC